MHEHVVGGREKLRSVALEFLEAALAQVRPAEFAIRLWDGTVWSPVPHAPPRFTLVLHHPGALRRMFLSPSQFSLGDSYIHGDFDIEGDLDAAFSFGDALLDRSRRWRERLALGRRLLRMPAPERSGGLGTPLRGAVHSRERDRQAIGFHYDISNDFYRLWLDRRMVYSCAYFSSADDELDPAQERKLDYICRKLRLERGERLLDIGCGWGAMVMHAARHYGVDALGITLSAAQAELAAGEIGRAGLGERCRVAVRDYRDLENEGAFDKLVSIGMVEHVGRKRLPEYFALAWQLLRPGGIFLNHGISESLTNPPPRGRSFIDRYVFPDGELVPVSEMVRVAEAAGFEVRDMESLREHYALTLQRWVSRLDAAWDAARQATDEVTCRVWRLYMAGSAHGFATGRLNLYQLLLVKPQGGASGFPLTRDYLYS
ncbi:SAM-dependent methyltransferase [Geobacter pickeringii]|uniref:Cyclopropane-fatty-acyl-phospholipid synthase n=1 Tax=Geobacter pickeringii TaxID=345632 RepID=A0A0B5BDD9_9BACT|nr:cyclopropane-fatty-acyl-phospholipid synthase family protein [Geobacter pickeringii]AJE03139.1 cyclopropane-fatty-acyl-phospholipid synthase [Geobacter pickeringii]